MNLTASGLPRAKKCPASAVLPQIKRLRADGERGTDLHAEREAAAPDTHEVAFAFNAETGAVRHLGNGKKREYGELAPTEIAGTCDVVIVETDRVIVRDYKSGVGYHVAPAKENLQLGFGAVCAAAFHGKDSARVEIVYVDQDDRIDRADLDTFDIAGFRDQIKAIWLAATKRHPTVATGDHCWMCPCIANCPAYLGLAKTVAGGDLSAVLPVAPLTVETVAKGWQNVKALRRLIAEVDGAYRGFAALWPVPLGDGKFLGERMKSKEELDGQVTRQVLRDLHGEKVADAACEISTSKAAVERALATVAAKGQKAGMMRTALKAIEESNGISVRKTMTVEEYSGGE